MGDNFLAKAFEWAWNKGLSLFLVWVFGSVHIFKADSMFGVSFNDSERGFLITLLALACIALHFSVKFWISRQRYYDPKNFSDEVRNATNSIRDDMFLIMSTRASRDAGPMWADACERIQLNSSRAQDFKTTASIVEFVNLALNLLSSKDTAERDRIDGKMMKLAMLIRNKTDWVTKK